MKKLKVMTVVGTRPEIIRLSRVIPKLDTYFDHCLVHTGQNYDYELNQVFFDELEIRRPDHFLDAAGTTAAETIGRVIMAVDELIGKEQPDALLVLGDTNSCLSVIPAKRRRVPVFHMEAGNRCFDDRVPEEINRRIIDHVADINLPYSTIARNNLLAEGLRPDRVVKTGSPMREVLDYYQRGIAASSVLADLQVEKGQYFLVSAHREENVDNKASLARLTESLNAIAERYALPVLVSTHPRTRNRIEQYDLSFHASVRLLKPFGFFDYNALQNNARVVLSDSGSISEESAISGFPAINLREAHERAEAMEETAVMMTGLGAERILQALAILDDEAQRGGQTISPVLDYAATNVSEKVIRVILSYTDYVQRTVWKRY